jgi:hypothetical protein
VDDFRGFLVRFDVLNPRRAPRVPVRFSVELRHRFSSWSAETEDLGPGGCQIVTPRLLSRGRDVRVRLRSEELGRTVSLDGRVVWTRPEAPARIGVAFTVSGSEGDWFGELLASDPVAARILARTPDRLASTARLFLGVPPLHVADFSPDEEAVLRAAAGGLTVEALARTLGDGFERARGALFSLVSRRLIVLDPTSSVPPHRWRHLLGDVAVARAARELAAGARAAPAQALYDEGIAHLNAGRLRLAVQRFREALETSPGDEVIEGTVRRLGPWAG